MACNDPLPPSLQAMAPISASSDHHASWVYHSGGAAMWGGMVPYAILKGRNTLERVGRSDLLPTLNAYGEPGTNFGQPLTDTASHHLPIQDRGERLREAAPYFAEHVRQADDGEARVQRDVAAQEPIHGSRRARASSRRSREPRRAPPLVACPAGPPRRRSAPCPSADSRAPSAESGPGPPDRCAADPERAVGSSTPNADATRCDASAPPCRRGQRGGQSAASPRTGRGWTRADDQSRSPGRAGGAGSRPPTDAAGPGSPGRRRLGTGPASAA